MKQRFFYISNAFEESVKRLRAISGDSPAASGKVIRLCNAVRTQGGKATIISLGRCRQRGSWKLYPATIRRIERVPVIYAAYYDAPLLTHFVSTCSLLFILLEITRRDSVLIFYNFLSYYVPSLILHRLTGHRCLMDLEDGCRSDETSLKGRINHFMLRIHNAFCDGGVMLASSALMEQTPLRPAMVCYGVAPVVQSNKDWRTAPLQVLFGGALFKDTGVELFLESLNLLITRRPDIVSKIRLVVTGFGDMSENIREAAHTHFKGFVEFRGTVSSKEYIELLHESHVGLCLKMPDMSMGATTFPSKVVEMTAFGLLVVSTKVSDVPSLFTEETGVLLNKACPEYLAQALLDIADFPEKHRNIALQGQRELTSVLSSQRVGAELLAFWKGTNSDTGMK